MSTKMTEENNIKKDDTLQGKVQKAPVTKETLI